MEEGALPANKSVHDLSGRWTLDKILSKNVEETMRAQGVNFLIRKAVGMAKVTLEIHHQGAEMDIVSTASGTSTSTHEKRRLDWTEVENKISIFGLVRGRARVIQLGEGSVDTLKPYDFQNDSPSPEQPDNLIWLSEGWVCEENEAAGVGPFVIETQGECPEGGWASHQVWGFQMVDGRRKHVRKALHWRWKDGKIVEATLVYHWLGV